MNKINHTYMSSFAGISTQEFSSYRIACKTQIGIKKETKHKYLRKVVIQIRGLKPIASFGSRNLLLWVPV